MSDWNAAQYLRFATERTRPAADLLARVPLEEAAEIVDLGCGPGNSTGLIAARFPKAHITGVDSAPDMLAQARRTLSRISFVQSDLRDYTPHDAPDLVFANAVLQWLPDHATLVPRLARLLKPGGCLAFQVPDNLDEPSHALMRTVAADGPWSPLIGDAEAVRARIPSAGVYYDWLRAADCSVDIWATTYIHPLADAAAIVTWLQATGLRPFLTPLDHDMRVGFLAAYEAALETAYPRQGDGRVLLRFPRLFVVARRG
ncbi:trans-aconitate 2-methyltransferase [Methylobacterium brachythecii]|uniref:Trans-aconitate 2-methyltransferase n=1 Tax=Methylobacterium brachythecii TaxID=1176177 RepID=A0A7W6ACI2_9HYPH|nr:trans-aconitate 2-methyltransferase [Methylobacterium brachythecii]MBB3900728.1 trans-aconitate 2-methyltransferase [Methylobacterium brachythecii]GLS46588.1 trans-aconitate 2-methyltransferase [Methylobacterium brachythecii]